MVAPLLLAALPALISGASTLAGGIMGSRAEQSAADANFQINLLNYYQREQERQDAINEARRQTSESKLGSTDAEGNRVYFKPGVGWVTELSPEQQSLHDLYQTEEQNILGQDLPAKRDMMFKNIARQRGEGDYADALMQAMQRVDQENPRDVINRRNATANEGISEGYSNTLEGALRNAARTGSSNQDDIIASVGRAQGKDLRNVFMQNMEGARAESEDTYSRKVGNLGQLYNMFATRASAMPDVRFNPRDISGPSSSQAQQAGQTAAGGLLNAFGKQGGTMTDVPTLYGPANTVAQTGSAIMAAMNRQNSREQMDQGYGSYDNFLSGGTNNTNMFPAAPSPYGGTDKYRIAQGTGALG